MLAALIDLDLPLAACPSLAPPLAALTGFAAPTAALSSVAPALAAFPGFESTAATAWFWVMALVGLLWLRRHWDISVGAAEPVLSDADAAPCHCSVSSAPPTHGPAVPAGQATADTAVAHRTETGDADRPAAAGVAAGEWPRLSMLVAGKEEEENIERCLRGLLAQDYPNLEVIAINDRSADRTGEILDKVAAEDDRLTPVHIQQLPAGWFGKNNAMQTGVEQASGEWLAFTDADCVFDSTKLLAAAVAFARKNGVEFLSVLPQLEAGTFWEKVVQPVAGGIMVIWNPPKAVNNPKSSAAYANGAFMLMTRDAYERLGTHAAVKATLNEDMHFARRAKQVGVRLRVIRGGAMYRVRMYTGLRQIWRGWSRIFYGCFGTLPKLMASLLLLAVASISPYVTLLLSPLADEAWWKMSGVSAFTILAQQTVLWRFYRLSGLPGRLAWSYVLGAALCLGMIINAITKALGATTTNWRGTTYAGGH